jgi:hypothetical protein
VTGAAPNVYNTSAPTHCSTNGLYFALSKPWQVQQPAASSSSSSQQQPAASSYEQMAIAA